MGEQGGGDFVCILGEEDVVYDVYVAAAAIDIRPTKGTATPTALLALRPKYTGAAAQRRAFHAGQKPPLAPTGGGATVALQYKIRKSPVNQPQQRHETQWVSSLL